MKGKTAGGRKGGREGRKEGRKESTWTISLCVLTPIFLLLPLLPFPPSPSSLPPSLRTIIPPTAHWPWLSTVQVKEEEEEEEEVDRRHSPVAVIDHLESQ